MKKLLEILLVSLFGAAAVAAEYALENEHLALEVNITGGRIQRLLLKSPALELTSGEGLLGDNFYNIPEAKFFLTALPYKVGRSANQLLLSANHRGGGIDFMELSKKIELPPGETSVHVHYTFHNLPASMAAVEYGFWSHNFMGVPGQEINCFFPCINGITLVPSKRAETQCYYKKPSRGWLGYAFSTGGGLAITMDYALLDQFYGWYGKECTQEFYFDKFKLAQDETHETKLELIAFHTLKKISGVGGGLVGDLSLTELAKAGLGHRIMFELYSAKAQDVRLDFSVRRLRDGKPEKFAEHKVKFAAPATLQKIEFDHNFKVSPAILDIEVRAFAPDGKLLAIFNAPLGIDTTTLAYRMLPEIDRKQEKGLQIDLNKIDKSLATDGIIWTKPFVGGKLCISSLTPYQSYAEVAKLAASLDAELYTTMYLSQGRPANASGDYFGLLSEADIADNIDILLQKPCDVMLIAGVNFDKLSAAQRQEIVAKVENGCGLVLIGVSGKAAELAALSPFAPCEVKSYSKKTPEKAREGYLSTAIPWALIPATTCVPYDANGEIHATVAGLPYLVVRSCGKGKVASLPWISSGGSGRMVGGLTPDLVWPLPEAYYRDYPECHRLLLAKMLTAVAGRDAGMRFSSLKAESAPGKFTVTVNLEALPVDGKDCSITLFTRNRDGIELARQEYRFTPQGSQSFKLLTPAWNGPMMIGLILRNDAGEVVDFGAIAGQRLPMLRIHSLSADKVHYQEGEMAVFSMKAAADEPGEIHWQLRDAFARTVQAGKTAAASEMSVQVPIASSLFSRNYTFVAEAHLKDKVVDRHFIKVTATPRDTESIWEDYQVGLWITPYSYDAARQFLDPELSAAFRKMFVTTIMGNVRNVDLDFALRNNFTPTIYHPNGTRPSAVNKEYHKTQDKMLLQRTPCLSNPAFRAEMQKTFAELGKTYADKGIGYYWFGDELSLTGYWSSAVDFCFSPTCLAEFAGFMQKKYGSVERANAQWDTKFSAFSEFIPETLNEARQHTDGNYSAWADHLEYMDSLLTEYVAFFTGSSALRAGDPAARSFISGPQGPSAYGGNNWALQGPAYSGLMSYSYGGLEEILHSFAPETLDLPWILGYANYEGKVCYELWRSLQLRARGAMAFSAASMIRSDYSLSRSGEAVAKFLPEIMHGIGKLFISVLREASPEVEIIYSQPSIRAAYISNRAKVHEEIRMQYLTLCRNFGVPFRFTSEAEIQAGRLEKDTPKLLIFPDSAALSDEILTQIGTYLKSGGTVLADGVFAEMDASCRVRQGRILPSDEKFLRRDSTSAHYFDVWRKDAECRESQENAVLAEVRTWFGGVLARAGITPRCKLELADGTTYLDGEIALFQDAQHNDYVLAISKEAQPVAVRPVFSGNSATACNVRQCSETLKNDNPLLYALLAKDEPPELALSVSGKGRNFVLKSDIQCFRDTVLRLTVRNQAGEIVEHYGANLTARQGKNEYSLDLALNDAPGSWSVELRDVVTGQSATRTIEVKQRTSKDGF